MNQIKVRCPNCSRERVIAPHTTEKDKWTAVCFFCRKSFKVYPKNQPARVTAGKIKRTKIEFKTLDKVTD